MADKKSSNTNPDRKKFNSNFFCLYGGPFQGDKLTSFIANYLEN